MYTHIMLVLALFLADGADLEVSGEFMEAGRAYFQDGDLAGEARILSRYLEEALYSGNSIHALDIIMQLERFDLQQGFVDYWYARFAWSCGLAEYSCEALDEVAGSPWLESRAAGTACQFRGDPESAVTLFARSMEEAVTVRQKFYSALDLSFALVQSGRYHEAEQIASILAGSFPGEGLPLAAMALSLHGQGRFGQAMMVLQTLYTGAEYSYIARDLARSLMRDFE